MSMEFEGDACVDEQLDECEKQTKKTGGGDRNYLKLEEGEAGNKVRIFPPLKGQKAPWYHASVHFGLIGSNGKPMPVLCAMEQFGECPLCRESAIYREQGDNLKSWQMAAKDFYLYNVLNSEGEFYILSADKKLQTELIKTFKFARSEDGGAYSPWDVKQGCSLKIVKSKGAKSGNQKFAPNVYAVHALPRKAISESILEAAPASLQKLDEIYRVFKPEEIQGMIDGTFDPYEKKNEEATEAPAKKAAPAATAKPKTAPKSAPKPAPEADEMDNIDDVVEDAKKFVNNASDDDDILF